MRDWYATFGLKCSPFSKELEHVELWVPRSKAHHADRVGAAIEQREAGVLTVGEPGVGKLHLLRMVRHRADGAPVRLGSGRAAVGHTGNNNPAQGGER